MPNYLQSNGDNFIERYLTYHPKVGAEENFLIRIGTPQINPKKPDEWFCYVEIQGSNLKLKHNVYGIDVLQCLIVAITLVYSELNRYFHIKGGEFAWLGARCSDLDKCLSIDTLLKVIERRQS